MQHACMLVYTHSQFNPEILNETKKALAINLLKYSASLLNIAEMEDVPEFEWVDYPLTATTCKTVADHVLMGLPLDKEVIGNTVAMFYEAVANMGIDIKLDDFDSAN